MLDLNVLAGRRVEYLVEKYAIWDTPTVFASFSWWMCVQVRWCDTICLTLCLFFFSGGQVAKLYRDASLGNVVNIIVTRLIVLTEDQVRKIYFLCHCLLKNKFNLYDCFTYVLGRECWKCTETFIRMTFTLDNRYASHLHPGSGFENLFHMVYAPVSMYD